MKKKKLFEARLILGTNSIGSSFVIQLIFDLQKNRRWTESGMVSRNAFAYALHRLQIFVLNFIFYLMTAQSEE